MKDEDNCAQILACIGDNGLWFHDRAIDWNKSTLSGQIIDGATCESEWGQQGWFSRSVGATLSCSNDQIGTFRYTADSLIGTGITEGQMNDGASVNAWTGKNVLAYLTPEGERHALLPCGLTIIPVS